MRKIFWRLVGAYTLLRLLVAFFAGGWMRKGALLRSMPWLMNRVLPRRSRLRRVLQAVSTLAMTRMRAQQA